MILTYSVGVRFGLCSVLSASIALAANIYVPADQPTIQAAINAAEAGDIVIVSPGTYTEQINFKGKAITVQSASGAKTTIIDGGNNGSVVSFISGESSASILYGFTVRNGSGTVGSGETEGGGIEISNSSPTVSANLITQNTACDGAGISISNGGSPRIASNFILRNSDGGCAGLGGGGISIHGAGAPKIIANTISGNTQCCASGGGIYINYSTGVPLIENNMINGNVSGSGGGIYGSNQGDANVVQNVITGNSAPSGAGVYWVVPENTRGPLLVNNTIAYNDITQTCPDCQGSAVYIEGFYQSSLFADNLLIGSEGEIAVYCDITYSSASPILYANDGFSANAVGFGGSCSTKQGILGNISEPPLFVDPLRGIYQLQAMSPAIDSGANSAPALPSKDIDGNPRVVDGNGDGVATVDMGAYEFQPPPM